jgi:hypothetical protein
MKTLKTSIQMQFSEVAEKCFSKAERLSVYPYEVTCGNINDRSTSIFSLLMMPFVVSHVALCEGQSNRQSTARAHTLDVQRSRYSRVI